MFTNACQEFGVPPLNIWWPKNIKILARFQTTLRLNREYLQKAIKNANKNCIANYGHSGKRVTNLVNFGGSFDPPKINFFRMLTSLG